MRLVFTRHPWFGTLVMCCVQCTGLSDLYSYYCLSTDKPTSSLKKQTSQSVSTGSDSEGGGSDKPLLHFKERDTAVSYRPGGKKKQTKKVEL